AGQHSLRCHPAQGLSRLLAKRRLADAGRPETSALALEAHAADGIAGSLTDLLARHHPIGPHAPVRRLEDGLVGLKLGALLRGVRALAGLVDATPCVGRGGRTQDESRSADSGDERTRQLEHLKYSLCKQKADRA